MRFDRSTVFLIAFAALIGFIAVGSTWRVFSQTNDEPAHIAAGMEWLEQGRYTYEPKHPPLPRILFALGPWLRGIRLAEAGNPIDQGNNLLHHQGRYSSNLSFARADNLPFLLLGILVVVAWSRHLYGTGAALISAILFVSSAPVLGLAGLAVNDLAAASTIAAALLAFVLWLESPTIGRSVLSRWFLRTLATASGSLWLSPAPTLQWFVFTPPNLRNEHQPRDVFSSDNFH